MKLAQKLILLVGIAMLAFLFWKMDAGAVWVLVASVGWGFVFILGQEIVAHVFNALGWRYAFRAKHAGAYSLRELMKFRIVGDGVNYLTPSAQIAGEFARAALLNPTHPIEVRVSSVVVGKFTQGLAQMLFGLFGITLLLRGRISWLAPYENLLLGLAMAAAAGMVVLLALEAHKGRRSRREKARSEKDKAPPPGSGLWALPRQLRRYLQDHPGRFVISILMFMLGYAWGAFEAYWICRFLGVPVTVGTAFSIEVLSCVIDGLLFMVPAKMGTQEAGKTAIFALLGMPPQSGLAFGVTRHIRELVWASGGLGWYSHHLRRHPRVRTVIMKHEEGEKKR